MSQLTTSQRMVLEIVEKYPESKKAISELFPFIIGDIYKVGDVFQWSLPFGKREISETDHYKLILINEKTIGSLKGYTIKKTITVDNVDAITNLELRRLFGGNYFEMRLVKGNKLIDLP